MVHTVWHVCHRSAAWDASDLEAEPERGLGMVSWGRRLVRGVRPRWPSQSEPHHAQGLRVFVLEIRPMERAETDPSGNFARMTSP